MGGNGRGTRHIIHKLADIEQQQQTLLRGAVTESMSASSASVSTTLLALIFAGWYSASALTGTSTKALIRLSTSPLTITLTQFLVSAIASRVICGFRGKFVSLTLEEYRLFAP